MNRKERRTRGKFVVERLAKIKNSSLLQEADLKDIPKETLDQLIAGTCENKVLQRKYRSIQKLLDEMISLEIELNSMRDDLAEKQKGLHT